MKDKATIVFEKLAGRSVESLGLIPEGMTVKQWNDDYNAGYEKYKKIHGKKLHAYDKQYRSTHTYPKVSKQQFKKNRRRAVLNAVGVVVAGALTGAAILRKYAGSRGLKRLNRVYKSVDNSRSLAFRQSEKNWRNYDNHTTKNTEKILRLGRVWDRSATKTNILDKKTELAGNKLYRKKQEGKLRHVKGMMKTIKNGDEVGLA